MADWLLIGATGMVGTLVRAQAAARPLTLLTRGPVTDLSAQHAGLVLPPTDWARAIADAAPAALISCLGTTIRQAGSQAAFRAVDHDLLLAAASAARAAGARHLITVSSVGASAKAANFYLRTKGEAEDGLRALGFPRLDILRPGLLTGQRGGAFRRGEALAMLAAPVTDALLLGGMRRYRSIAALDVARAIIALAQQGGSGTQVHEHDAIRAAAAHFTD